MTRYLVLLSCILLMLAAGCVGTPEYLPAPGQPPAGQSPSTPGGVLIGETPGSTEPGTAPASGPAGGTSMPAPSPAQWLTYRDERFGFSFQYPDSYVVLEEKEPLSQIHPNLVHRVRLLEKQLAESETASLQPPNFSVEVFSNPSGLSLRQWIESQAALQGEQTDETIGGAQCVRVTLTTLMAPNEFHFCAHGGYVYRLIALSPYQDEMLASFRFGG
jgi:hypothetical protein